MIDLKPFCSTNPTRSVALGQPWSAGEFTYATDGRILVRVPSRADVPENPKAPKTEHIVHLFDDNPHAGEFRHLPEFTKPQITECESCKGSGQCECPRCRDEHACGACDGTGKVEEKLPGVEFGSQFVSPHYLALLATLPNVTMANGEANYEALSFRFDGGDGRLMPLMARQ